ncbi:Hsp20/alpha crystallin family protein [Desemzia sp. FAM 23991]|uniref:Hsp20/alpha crystallin family protein n=1 Tax=unclassified Desemzia TaxID=2685243 RepID=UPI00388B5360
MNSLFPFRRDFMNVDRNFFGDSFDHLFSNTANFDVDIKESDTGYILEADMPGLAKEDIQLDYHNNVLSINAHQEEGKDETDEKGNYIHRERSVRSYSRQFILKDVEENAITAKFDNGVLTVHLPKKEVMDSPKNRIEIQ